MRRRAASAGLAAALVLGGCHAGRTDAAGAGDDLPDCSTAGCADEVASYSDAVAALPGVAAVRDVAYEPEQVTDSASVSGAVTVGAATACDDLEDELGRLLWESPISPVASVRLRCYLAGQSGPNYDYAGYSFALEDPEDLTERWGPRGG